MFTHTHTPQIFSKFLHKKKGKKKIAGETVKWAIMRFDLKPSQSDLNVCDGIRINSFNFG